LTDQIRSTQLQQKESIAAGERSERRRLEASQQSQESVFRQQLAQNENQARLNREAEEHAFGLQNAVSERNLLSNQQQQQEAIVLWDTLKDSLDPQTFVRGLVAIKQGKIPPELRTGITKPPQLSPSEAIELIGRIEALGLNPDEKRNVYKSVGLVAPVAEKSRIMTQSGRANAEIDATSKLPDPFFGGIGPGPAYSQTDLTPIYKNFLADNRYLIFGGEGRRELEDIWERTISVANSGSFFATTGGGRLNIKNQYEWNRESPDAIAARESFGAPEQRITQTSQTQISDDAIQSALQQARQQLGPQATAIEIRTRTAELLGR